MTYKLSNKAGNCCFQEYSKESKSMESCGKLGKVKTTKGSLCKEHALFAISNDKNRMVKNENGADISINSLMVALNG